MKLNTHEKKTTNKTTFTNVYHNNKAKRDVINSHLSDSISATGGNPRVPSSVFVFTESLYCKSHVRLSF